MWRSENEPVLTGKNMHIIPLLLLIIIAAGTPLFGIEIIINTLPFAFCLFLLAGYHESVKTTSKPGLERKHRAEVLTTSGTILGAIITAPVNVIIQSLTGAIIGALLGAIVGFTSFIAVFNATYQTGLSGAFTGAVPGAILGMFVGILLITLTVDAPLSISGAIIGTIGGAIVGFATNRDSPFLMMICASIGASLGITVGTMAAGGYLSIKGATLGASIGLFMGLIIEVRGIRKENDFRCRKKIEQNLREEEARRLRKETEQRKIATLKDEILSLINNATSDRDTKTRSTVDLKSEKLARGGSY